MYYLFILAAMTGHDAKFLCSFRVREFVPRLLNSPVCHKFAGFPVPKIHWLEDDEFGLDYNPDFEATNRTIGLSGIAL